MVGVKLDHCALESPYLYIDTERFITLISVSEIALNGLHLFHPSGIP